MSVALRRIKARTVHLEAEADAHEREWRRIDQRRRREIAAFEALALGAGQAALDLGQDAFDRFAGVGQIYAGHGRQGLGSDLIQKLQRVLGVCCDLSGKGLKYALKRMPFACVIHHHARELVQALALRGDQATVGLKRLFDRQNGVGRHRLLSCVWKRREKGESGPGETSAPTQPEARP